MSGDDPIDRCQSLLKDAEQAILHGRLPEAEKHFQAALREARESEVPAAVQAHCLGRLGRYYLLVNRYAEAEPLFREALELAHDSVGPANPIVGWLLASLAEVYVNRERYQEAKRLLLQALAILEQAPSECNPDLAMTVCLLGAISSWEGQHAEAQAAFRRALALLGADDWRRFNVLATASRHYYYREQYDTAAALLEEALALAHRDRPTDTQCIVRPLIFLADVRRAQGRMRDMARLLKEALDAARLAHDRPHLDVAWCLDRLATAFREQEKYGSAERFAEESLRIKQAVHGPRHSDIARTLCDLAMLRYARGRHREAEDFFRQALDAEADPKDPDVPLILRNLGSLLAAQPDRSGEAAPYLRRALALGEELRGIDHPWTAQVRQMCIAYFRALGREAEAAEVEAHAEAVRNAPPPSSQPAGEPDEGDEPAPVALEARWDELVDQARGAQNAGDLAGAEQLLTEALAVANQFTTLDRRVAQTLALLAAVCFARGKVAEGEQFGRRALPLMEQATDAADPALIVPLEVMVGIHSRHEDWAAAERLLRRLLDLHGQQLGEDHPEIMRLARYLGINLWHQGRYAEAESFFRRAVVLGHKVLAEDNSELGVACCWLARVCEQLGRASEAQPLLRRAVAILETIAGKRITLDADTLLGLVACCDRLGERETAERALRLGLDCLEQAYGWNHPNLRPLVTAGVEMYRRWGRPDDATFLAYRSLEVAVHMLAPDGPDLLQALRRHVARCMVGGMTGVAESACQELLDYLQTTLGPRHLQVAACLEVYAEFFRQIHFGVQAELMKERARSIREQQPSA